MTLFLILFFIGSIGYWLKYVKHVSIWSSINIIFNCINLKYLFVMILLFFSLKLPISVFTSCLGLESYYFIFCGIYAIITTIFTCLLKEKDLPRVLGLLTIVCTAMLFAIAIKNLNIQYKEISDLFSMLLGGTWAIMQTSNNDLHICFMDSGDDSSNTSTNSGSDSNPNSRPGSNASKDFPLNVPEASRTGRTSLRSLSKLWLINTGIDGLDEELTKLRNQVRTNRLYLYRLSQSGLTDEVILEGLRTKELGVKVKNELRRYLNSQYNGNFSDISSKEE